MLAKVKMTKTGAPMSFLANTFRELKRKPYDASYNKISTVHYKVDAFWITSRNNGRMGLAFGTQTFSFNTTHDLNRSKHEGLTYSQFLDAAQPASNRYAVDVYTEEFTFDNHGTTQIVWDGGDMWSQAGSDRKDLIPVVFPQLIAAYPQLPSIPAGADGWYKLVQS